MEVALMPIGTLLAAVTFNVVSLRGAGHIGDLRHEGVTATHDDGHRVGRLVRTGSDAAALAIAAATKEAGVDQTGAGGVYVSPDGVASAAGGRLKGTGGRREVH